MPLLFFVLIFTTGLFAQEVDCPPDKTIADQVQEKILPRLKHIGYISQKELEQYSSQELGEMIVRRIQEQCGPLRGDETGIPLAEDSELMMYVPMSVLDGIEKYGVLNQHYTGSTNGADATDYRYSLESTLSGLMHSYSPKGLEVLPKYTVLNIPRPKNNGKVVSPTNYGDVILVFKNDVKRRTTWTPKDSFSLGNSNEVSNTLDFKDNEGKHFKCSRYCEGQVWGALNISDVGYAMIGEGAQVPDVFKRHGIPVKRYSKAEDEPLIAVKETLYDGKKKIVSGPMEPMETAVTKRVTDFKGFESLSSEELMKIYSENQSKQLSIARTALGQLAQHPKSTIIKEFFLKTLAEEKRSFARTQILYGLAQYGDDSKVRDSFYKFLSTFSYPKFSSDRDIDKLMALAIIADTTGFKDDKKLLDLVGKMAKNQKDPDHVWYARLFNKKPLCELKQ